MSVFDKEKIKLIIKYFCLSVLVGVLAGALDALFGRVLIYLSEVRTKHYMYLVPFLPFAGFIITYSYHKLSKLSLKGMTLVFETGQKKRDDIPLALIPLVMVGTWITHLFGGSAGREGVAVQLGATLSHAIARKTKMPDNGRVMLVMGMAAGFAGLFQTPLTATFFAMEVIVAGVLAYEALFPALVAAFTASYTSSFLGLEKFAVDLPDKIVLSRETGIQAVILGLAFGLTGWLFSFALQFMKSYMFDKISNPYYRIVFVSIPLAIILMVAYQGRFCGLGTNLISASFNGDTIYAYDWILKIIFTVITLSIGFQGGEVTPLFAIGSSLGCVLGSMMGFPVEFAAALGYAAVFGSATNTLIAPILIGIEVFDSHNMVFFVIVCAVAFIVNRNSSIYTAQQIAESGVIERK